MAILTNRFFYDAAPNRVWAMITDCEALAKVCQPYLQFEGLPEGRIFTTQKIDVRVRLFGRLPAQNYHMAVKDCDEDAMRFESRESGAGVKRWNHKAWLTPDGSGTRLDETIDIDAGFMTPLFWLWARVLYRGRHRPRVALLNSGEF